MLVRNLLRSDWEGREPTRVLEAADPTLAPPNEGGEVERSTALARETGFRDVQHVSAVALAQRYFAGRTDGLRPPNNSEELP
jgi:hypothetical protein